MHGMTTFWTQFWRWLWPWRWLGLIIIGTWILTMIRLATGPSFSGAKELEELYPWAVQKPLHIGDEWVGIYMVGKKIGYAHTQTESQTDGFLITNRSLMKMQLFGSFQTIQLLSKVHTDKRYRLRQFTFLLRSPLSLFRAEGQVVQDQLRILWYMGEQKVRMSLPYRPSMLPSVLRPYIAAQKPPPGRKLRAVLFDPQSRSYTQTLIEVESYENIRMKGKTVRALRLRQQYRDMSLLAWIDEEGKILKEQAPGGMMLLRESAREAVRGIEQGFDIIQATRIPLYGRIDQPQSRQTLQVRLENIVLASFPELNGGRQTLNKAKGILSIAKESPQHWPKRTFSSESTGPSISSEPSPKTTHNKPRSKEFPTTRKQAKVVHASQRRNKKPSAEDRRKRALEESPLIQSKHPKIRKQAQEIIQSSTDRLRALQSIAQWVFRTLQKRSVVGIPNALETLEKKVGDCNEHATLLAALARAVKIPCELVTGVAYQDGNFYFHAWNECEVNPGQWLSLDATWGQFPSDVTHIAFARGGLEKQMALIQLLGQLRIRVVSEVQK